MEMCVLCASCLKLISRKHSKNIQCVACMRLYHVSVECSGVTEDQFDSLSKSQKNHWKCPPCVASKRESVLEATGDGTGKALPSHPTSPGGGPSPTGEPKTYDLILEN